MEEGSVIIIEELAVHVHVYKYICLCMCMCMCMIMYVTSFVSCKAYTCTVLSAYSHVLLFK